MKVALVWHGQVREFEKCIKPWTTFINIHKPDIFIHTWRTNSKEITVDKLPAFYNIKSVLIEESNNMDHLKDGVTAYGSSALNVLPQMYSIYKADELRRHYEEMMGVHYDWILRSRMDISLNNAGGLQFSQMSPNKVHVCSNHWGHIDGMYDDNIMATSGRFANISEYFLMMTIKYIAQHRLIPSGEQLLSNHLRTIKDEVYKNPMLDFTLGRQL